MIENIKAVNNPLTIIAIFAALAEIAGTVALKIVSGESQVIFIWFVMLFPMLLVLLFFLTLNFNPKVLYAPSDFRNEENFLNAISGVKRLSVDLSAVQKQLENAKAQIIDEAVMQIGIAGENERSRLAEIVNNRIISVQESIETTKESVEEVAVQSALLGYHRGVLANRILKILTQAARPLLFSEILQKLDGNISKTSLSRRLRELTMVGEVEAVTTDSGERRFKVRNASDKEE